MNLSHERTKLVFRRTSVWLWLGAVVTMPASVWAQGDYTYTDLGLPAGADSAIGVRMNNQGQVAGWSVYYGQGEPSLKGWVWTPGAGFTILPPPPGFFDGRSRAMDISDDGVVAGDGGYDSGLAWRYENGAYEVTGNVEGMPGAYLGGINNNGDIAGTAKDATITTPDFAFVDFNGGALLNLTPSGGRATDLNNNGQVCGYLNAGPFQAYRWDQSGGIQLLGTLGLAYSFANAINDSGDVVGVAESGTGNTQRAWIYTDAGGMQELPAPYRNSSWAIQINNQGHVIGMTAISGPDLSWLWTGGASVTLVSSLFDTVGLNVNLLEVKDINNAGQILARVFDNNVVDYRTVILTPPSAPAMPCDFDLDGDVDLTDFSMFSQCFGGSANPPALSCPPGVNADLDGDGDVDALDFVIFTQDFTGSQ